MKIKKFKEAEIRKAIIKKANPTINSKRSKHEKGLISLGGRVVARVKIPNEHQRIMEPSKSKHIASDLRLKGDEFNKFVECSLRRNDYLSILKSQNLQKD